MSRRQQTLRNCESEKYGDCKIYEFLLYIEEKVKTYLAW